MKIKEKQLLLIKATIWGFLVPIAVLVSTKNIMAYLGIIAFLGAFYNLILKKDNLFAPVAAFSMIVVMVAMATIFYLKSKSYPVILHQNGWHYELKKGK